jgi:8-oxo-dGTP diphosphatase
MEAVCGIIFNGRGEVLLTQRRDVPVWVLPGGGIEPGESPEAAVCREILEETGYRAEIVRKVAEYLPVNRMTRVTHFFECRIVGGHEMLTSETRGIGFYPLTALPQPLAPPYLGWIQDASLKQPTVIHKKIEGVSYFVLMKLLITHPLLTFRFLLTKLGIHLNF